LGQVIRFHCPRRMRQKNYKPQTVNYKLFALFVIICPLLKEKVG